MRYETRVPRSVVDPDLIIQVGCPTCCYQVCELDHAKGGTADLAHPSKPCHFNILILSVLHIFAQWKVGEVVQKVGY